MAELKVKMGRKGYPVIVERGVTAGLGDRLLRSANSSRTMVIADHNTAARVRAIYRDPSEVALFEVPAGESSKSFEWLQRACAYAAEAGLDRGSTVVAVGGGVVGDLAGTVAAVYMRGVDLVHVPTTLLAMVDSSIGGKAAINLAQGKNLVGAFKPPAAVYVDPELLESLPEREYRSGLAEVIKYAMIADEGLYQRLVDQRRQVQARDMDVLTDVITTCCAIKVDVVSRDEREGGERAILNYGHTFGHALEAATGYGVFTHGEAISVGMTVAARIGQALGLTPSTVSQRQGRLLDAYGLPQKAPGASTLEQTLDHIARDKKSRAGATPWVLLEAVGKATWGHVVDQPVVEKAIDFVLAPAARQAAAS